MKIPVILVTGFLGSGKTTLMRVIAGLEGSEGERAKIVIRKQN